jgi:glycosyltransferase involved in cell wall biosynthesis
MTYNHENYIRNTIISIVSQKTNFNYEVIVHDDASTDNTQLILRELSFKYPDKIKLILRSDNAFKENKFFTPLKSLLDQASGQYIAYLEGDDWWIDTNHLQIKVDLLESNDSLGQIFSASIVKKNKKVYRIRPEIFGNGDKLYDINDMITLGAGLVSTSTLVFRKSQMDGFFDFFRPIQLWDYQIQIYCSRNMNSLYLDSITSIYHELTDSSITKKITLSSSLDKLNIYNDLSEMIIKCNYLEGVLAESTAKVLDEYNFQIVCINKKLSELFLSNFFKKANWMSKYRQIIYFFFSDFRLYIFLREYKQYILFLFRFKLFKPTYFITLKS